MPLRLLHFADLHLDTVFTWAPRELAEARRQALRDTLRAITTLARTERVDALLCGGDLLENERVSPDTAAFLRSEFASVEPTPVLLAPGNHDWLGPQSLYRHVDWSPNVHIFSEDRLSPYQLVDGVTVWGAAHLAPANTDDFLSGFGVDRGGVNIALFHGSEQHALAAQGQGKQPHAPFDAAEISASGLKFAFLGHYHTPQDATTFTYPGNPDPLSFGESGPRGAILATFSDDGAITLDRRIVAHSHVEDCVLDVTGCTSAQDIRDKGSSLLAGRRGVIRLTVTGELNNDVQLDAPRLSTVSTSAAAVVVRVEGLRPAYDIDRIKDESTVRGQFVRDVLAADIDEERRRRVLVTGLRALGGRNDLEVP